MSFNFNNILPSHIAYNNKRVGTLLYNNKIVWQEGLPEEYTRLNYIASSGTQYIDTGIVPNQNTGFEIEFLSNDELSNSGFGCILGAREKSGINELQLTSYVAKDSDVLGTLRFGTTSYNANIIANEKNIISLKNKVYTSNGTEQIFTDEFTAPSTLTLFALNQNGTATQFGSVRIYSCKIYDGNKLLRNFIPCINSENVVGLYDIILGQFYTNQGEGEFVSSYILPSDYTQIEYIKATGTQYIDTGVPLKSGLKINIDLIYEHTTARNTYMGAHIGSNPGNRWLIGSQTSSKYYFFAIGALNTGTEFIMGNRDIIEACWLNPGSYIKVNGVKTTRPNFSTTKFTEEPNYTFYLGANNRDGKAANMPVGITIYSCKFYQDDILIRDLIPCVDSNNEAGLYDLLNNKFYKNNGTGTFEAGQNI